MPKARNIVRDEPGVVFGYAFDPGVWFDVTDMPAVDLDRLATNPTFEMDYSAEKAAAAAAQKAAQAAEAKASAAQSKTDAIAAAQAVADAQAAADAALAAEAAAVDPA